MKIRWSSASFAVLLFSFPIEHGFAAGNVVSEKVATEKRETVKEKAVSEKKDAVSETVKRDAEKETDTANHPLEGGGVGRKMYVIDPCTVNKLPECI